MRGSLLDIFPMGESRPLRIDLLDDEIDSIRRFDPESQLSANRLESVRVLPAREFPMHENARRLFRDQCRERFEGNPQDNLVYRNVSNGNAPGGIEYYLPLFFNHTESFFDYLPANITIAYETGLADEVGQCWARVSDRYQQRKLDPERPCLRPDEICFTPKDVMDAINGYPRIVLNTFKLEQSSATQVNLPSQAPPKLSLHAKESEPARELLDFLDSFDGRVLFSAESTGRREMLRELLTKRKLEPRLFESWQTFNEDIHKLGICVAPLVDGIFLPGAGLCVICELQLFGERARQVSRRRSDRDPAAIIRDLNDLADGAPVVHEDHGVGRYLGLRKLEIRDIETEYLLIEYAEADKLYVPVSSLHLVSRYTGSNPDLAPLHKLGGEQWSRAKKKAADKARDAAAELLEIYARRATREGYRYPINEQDYEAFVGAFPFDETPDQKTSIDSVLSDLTGKNPMDRLVCGDVGFGKTEVALRASFVAVQGNRQVAVLVPTTLLAQQHYQNFCDRFADWPIKIEMLSRFRSAKQQQQTLQGLIDGTVDIVIATHALLSDRVQFKNIGLLIIDEEHRFGVRHKEIFKKMRAEIDVLTLTATPIPRTLNMSLSGIRDLSIIATPPVERLSIRTFVSEWNEVLTQEAIRREIRRGGQVYFVHNKVESIDKMAEKISNLVPEAEVRIAHGQMRESALEQVMLDFYHRRFNVLLCTTIIESGIDVPTANTIIIERADRFGLAQLHQLRGRVGRSHHRAYAYLFAPPRSVMTADAVKRLEAIEALEDLGAGFTLATHDLEIRGAGELLGEEQSGQIQEVGFALYSELLERAVTALKSGQIPDDDTYRHAPEVDLRTPALIPNDYIPDVHMRLVLYKRIAGAQDNEKLKSLQVEMIDRFGLLPDATRLLFEVTTLKLLAAPLGIRKIEAGERGGRVSFYPNPNIDATRIIDLVQQKQGAYSLDGAEKLRFKITLPTFSDRACFLRDLLSTLSPGSHQNKGAA